PTERPLRRGTGRGPGRAPLPEVLRHGRGPGVGHPPRRRPLPLLDLDHVPDPAGGRRGPGTAPAADPSGEEETRAHRPPGERGLVVGYNETPRPATGCA